MCCLACPAAVEPLSAGQSNRAPAIQPPDSTCAAFMAGTACRWWAKEGHTGNMSQRDCTTAWFGARERKKEVDETVVGITGWGGAKYPNL